MGERIRPIREFAREHCSVLLIAHNRKAASDDGGDEISGSNAFASSVDGWISAIYNRLYNHLRRSRRLSHRPFRPLLRSRERFPAIYNRLRPRLVARSRPVI